MLVDHFGRRPGHHVNYNSIREVVPLWLTTLTTHDNNLRGAKGARPRIIPLYQLVCNEQLPFSLSKSGSQVDSLYRSQTCFVTGYSTEEVKAVTEHAAHMGDSRLDKRWQSIFVPCVRLQIKGVNVSDHFPLTSATRQINHIFLIAC